MKPSWSCQVRSAFETMTVFGIRANWLILGALLYPLFYGVGRLYVRLAEQAERDFVAVVDDGADGSDDRGEP